MNNSWKFWRSYLSSDWDNFGLFALRLLLLYFIFIIIIICLSQLCRMNFPGFAGIKLMENQEKPECISSSPASATPPLPRLPLMSLAPTREAHWIPASVTLSWPLHSDIIRHSLCQLPTDDNDFLPFLFELSHHSLCASITYIINSLPNSSLLYYIFLKWSWCSHVDTNTCMHLLVCLFHNLCCALFQKRFKAIWRKCKI